MKRVCIAYLDFVGDTILFPWINMGEVTNRRTVTTALLQIITSI